MAYNAQGQLELAAVQGINPTQEYRELWRVGPVQPMPPQNYTWHAGGLPPDNSGGGTFANMSMQNTQMIEAGGNVLSFSLANTLRDGFTVCYGTGQAGDWRSWGPILAAPTGPGPQLPMQGFSVCLCGSGPVNGRTPVVYAVDNAGALFVSSGGPAPFFPLVFAPWQPVTFTQPLPAGAGNLLAVAHNGSAPAADLIFTIGQEVYAASSAANNFAAMSGPAWIGATLSTIATNLVALRQRSGNLLVIMGGPDGNVFASQQTSATPTGWTGWASLPTMCPILCSWLALAQDNSGDYWLIGVNGAGAMTYNHYSWSSGHWLGWQSFLDPPIAMSQFSLVADSNGGVGINIVALDADGAPWQAYTRPDAQVVTWSRLFDDPQPSFTALARTPVRHFGV